MSDIETVEIQQLEEELKQHPRDGLDRAVRLLQLASVLQQRAVKLQSVEDLDRAIQRHGEIKQESIVGSHLRGNYLTLPTYIYRHRYELTKSIEDIELAIQAAEKATDLLRSRDDRILLISHIRSLVKSYVQRHQRIGDSSDIVAALHQLKKGFDTVVDDCQHREALQKIMESFLAAVAGSKHISVPQDLWMSDFSARLVTCTELLDHLKDEAGCPAEYYHSLGQLHYMAYRLTGEETHVHRAKALFLESLSSPDAQYNEPQQFIKNLHKSYYAERNKFKDTGALMFAHTALEAKNLAEFSRSPQILKDLALVDLMIWTETGQADHLKAGVSQLAKCLELGLDNEQESNYLAKEVAMGYFMIYQQFGSAKDLEISRRTIEDLEARGVLQENSHLGGFWWSLWQTQDLQSAISHVEEKQGPSETLQALKDKHINIEAQVNDDETPLYRAIEASLLGVVQWLVEHGGVDIHEQVDDQGTALHMAALTGRLDIARYLLRMGADINAKDLAEDQTPYQMALENGDVKMMQLLLDEGAIVDASDLQGSIDMACASGDEILLEKLSAMSRRLHLDGPGKHNLPAAVYNGRVHIVRRLLFLAEDIKGSEVEAELLQAASINGDVRMLCCLLDGGLSVNAEGRGESALSQAAKDNRDDAGEFLLRRGANVMHTNKDGMTPLHFAARNGRVKLVRLLLEFGASTSATCKIGFTPLMQACMTSRHAVVSLLLSRDASSVNHTNFYGVSPIWIGCTRNDFKTAELLLQAGADPKAQDKLSRSAFTLAQQQNTTAVAQLILDPARQRHITVKGDQPGAKNFATRQMSSNIRCDVCTRVIDIDCTYHLCSLCLTRSLHVCEGCRAMGAHCLDHTHILTEQKVEIPEQQAMLGIIESILQSRSKSSGQFGRIPTSSV